ncbi:hypothetical protein SDC9_143557 [bioreactor metagenome]|uniref:Uncharacterized protein n=1 Tax=bioreactor metagenome TaxID=1076179 RepID=A0A645E3M5_9ZZZZ
MNGYMSVFTEYDLITPDGVSHDPKLIPHGAAGNKDSCFFADYIGGQPLQSVDGGIISIYIIAYLGFKHGLSHLGCRHGYSIASQIYIPQ